MRLSRRQDRGAAAVELAIVLPVLLLVLFGLIDFGRAFNANMALTQAAREGARVAALGGDFGQVQKRTWEAATFPGGGSAGVTVTVSACPASPGPTSAATVRAAHTFEFVTPIGAIAGMFGSSGLGADITLTGIGVMRCAG